MDNRVSVPFHNASIVSFLALWFLALLPRGFASGDIVTVDEAYHWFERVEFFWQAIQQRDFAHTILTGHPGVTTMWLGTLGMVVHQKLATLGWIATIEQDAALYHTFLRFPIAMVSSLCIALAYPLLQQLYDKRVALLATLFWIGEPFLVAHAQLLHLDSLLTSFVMISLLTAMGAFETHEHQGPNTNVMHWLFLITSAFFAGLSFLTKSPSVILLPIIALIILTQSRQAGKHTTFCALHFPALRSALCALRSALCALRSALCALRSALCALRSALCAFSRFALWFTIAGMVWILLWPGVWADMHEAIRIVVSQAENDGGSPHGWGNFFMGQPVADPGLLFYPVVLVLRIAPWTMIGLFAAAAIILRDTLSLRSSRLCARPLCRSTRYVLPFFAILFLVMMSIPPKKFDRYVLPIFPVLDVLSAWGFVHLFDYARCKMQNARRIPPYLLHIIFAIGLAWNLFWYHPYEMAYYNPLVGGGQRAVQAIPVGWGEGYEQVRTFLFAQPNGCDRAVATWFIPVLRSSYHCNPWFVPMDGIFTPGLVDYAVLYIDQIQRSNTPTATIFLQSHFQPIHTVTIHGIPYASIYQLPLPNQYPIQADFGDFFRLRGYDVESSLQHQSGTITLTLQWEVFKPMTKDYMLFVHVFDQEGNRIGHIDVPPGGPRAPTTTWLPHGYVSWAHPVPLAPTTDQENYWIAIGVYDPESFARLPMSSPAQPYAPDDGPNTLMLLYPTSPRSSVSRCIYEWRRTRR